MGGSCAQLSEVHSSSAIADGVLYMGTSDGRVFALLAKTGGTLWSTTLGGGPIYSSPAVLGGAVYVGSDDRRLWKFVPQSIARR